MFAHLSISLFSFWHYQTYTVKHNIWQNTMIWQKKSIDWLTDYFSELALKSNFFGIPSHIASRESLLGASVNLSQIQTGQQRSRSSFSLFLCKKKREKIKKTYAAQKDKMKKTFFLKVTNHIGQESFVFIHEIGLYNMKPWLAAS